MSEQCENRNPLMRDGTSQQQRLIAALLPSYVAVDERSMSDLIEFANKFATQIQFYNDVDKKNGDWQDFFLNQVIDQSTEKTEPHYALFIAFLELFKLAQEDLNTITKRHLEFYYKDVLRLESNAEIPDQVFVIFELAQGVATDILQKDTGLNAGDDALGNERVYNTEKDVALNTSQAQEFKALFYNKNNDGRLYASPIANSANGLGEPIETPEPKWRTFGAIANPAVPFSSPQADRPQAKVGFALASPTLFLGEGNRVVTITLNVNSTTGLSNSDLVNAFEVMFTGETEWILPSPDGSKVPVDTTYLGPSGSNTIILQRTITEDQPAIVAYDDTVFQERFSTKWPIAKILLNTNNPATNYIYGKLKGLVINSADVKVDVDNVKNLIVQNDQATLDASKPFRPFGIRPILTSAFYVGSQEVFRKQVSSVNLNITWKGLPDDSRGFSGYYRNYIPASNNNKRKNNLYRANISILDGRVWKPLISQSSSLARLFEPLPLTVISASVPISFGFGTFISTPSPLTSFASTTLEQKLQPFRQIKIQNSNLANVPADPDLGEIEEFTNETEKGFLRLELANADFGHNDYQVSYATQAINAATTGDTAAYPLPNEPYTPLISELSLDYTSSNSFSLVSTPASETQEEFDNRVDQFFHVLPFGVSEQHPFLLNNTAFVSLVPEFQDEGTLYIGFENMVVPQNLSMLIKVAEGSANPDLPVQPVKWSYMVNNEWYTFPERGILSDGTNGLLTSGVITFEIPKTLNSDNTALPENLTWIKASVENNSGAVCDIISIQTQAVVAAFVNNGNDPAHFNSALPAESITSLVNSDADIASVSQPYASFGGRAAEEDTAFFVRISERLRHKNRVVNIWDYEHLILEKFPDIYKVKCINHTRYISENDINELAPGNVSLAVVSNLRNQNAVDVLQPKTSLITLSKIHDTIKKINPPCAEVFVKNPIYEEIVVHFNVRFREGIDAGFFANQLNDEIVAFLAPWAFETAEIFFGGRIDASVILNFVEERPYVDYVTCFQMDQITGSTTLTNIDEAVATTSASILTSAASHFINVLETDDCECEDNVVGSNLISEDCGCEDVVVEEQPTLGVGGGDIGGDFVVGAPDNGN